MPPTLVVTSLDAARRQLRTAIELWSVDGDPVSIHSLAFAAHHIIHDLNRANKGPSLLLDSPSVRPEKRDEFIALIKRDANFFKHADRRVKRGRKVETEIEFAPEINELFMVLAIQGMLYLGNKLTNIEIAFNTWYKLHHPDMLVDPGREYFTNGIDIKIADTFRAMSKKEFLEYSLKLQSSGASATL